MPPRPSAPHAPGGSFEDFARAARRIRRPDAGEERELARRSARGDIDARRALVLAELRLVLFHASRHRGDGVARADLVQEGVLGLLRAAERFDPDRGVRFATFAEPWVRHAIADAARRGRACAHVPAADARRAARLRRLEAAGAPDAAAAAALGLAAGELAALRAAATPAVSLDAVAGDDGSPLGERLAADDAETGLDRLAREETRRFVRAVLDGLPARERHALGRRFGLDGPPCTHDEIGADLGISGERARRILLRALARLRREPALVAHRLAA